FEVELVDGELCHGGILARLAATPKACAGSSHTFGVAAKRFHVPFVNVAIVALSFVGIKRNSGRGGSIAESSSCMISHDNSLSPGPSILSPSRRTSRDRK